MCKKTETIEEFLARGGKLKVVKTVEDNLTLRNTKTYVPPGEVLTSGYKSKRSYRITNIAVGTQSYLKTKG